MYTFKTDSYEIKSADHLLNFVQFIAPIIFNFKAFNTSKKNYKNLTLNPNIS